MPERPLQDQIPHNHCFGCGPSNVGGLGLKSYWSGSGPSVARYRPEPQHCASPLHFVNGGVIATVIDCHSICTATAAAYFRENRPLGSHPLLTFATARLDVRYRRPTPIDEELVLEAAIVEELPNGYIVECELGAGGKTRAKGRVKAVRVSEEWMGIG